LPLDLGCGWLHSAEENEWSATAAEEGFAIDRTPAPWQRPAQDINFDRTEQKEFRAAMSRLYGRIYEAGEGPDRPASDFLESGCRWNPLLDSVSTYANGVELDRLSVRDYARYHDTGVNWRVSQGYGALMQAYARDLDVKLGTPVTEIDHSGALIRVSMQEGALRARGVIITVPPTLLADETLRLVPTLPEKLAAAEALPLGLADKLFLELDSAEEFPAESRLFGAKDRATATYHLRPFGRPVIEGYFGGELARVLEREGEAAFFAFASDQLADALGGGIRGRLRFLAVSRWDQDPFARGSYSHARIGRSEARQALATRVEGRIFFAGEACLGHDYSTAHGAYRSGIRAAEEVIQALG
jgi:monoamine oxidase